MFPRLLNVGTVAVLRLPLTSEESHREVSLALDVLRARPAVAIVSGVRTNPSFVPVRPRREPKKTQRRDCLIVESLLAALRPAILRNRFARERPLRYRANAGGSSSAVARTQSGLPGPGFDAGQFAGVHAGLVSERCCRKSLRYSLPLRLSSLRCPPDQHFPPAGLPALPFRYPPHRGRRLLGLRRAGVQSVCVGATPARIVVVCAGGWSRRLPERWPTAVTTVGCAS